MGQPAHKLSEDTAPNLPKEAEPTGVTLDQLTIDASREAASSPARQLQNTLGREFAAVDAVDPRWSARQTMAFVVCSCGAFWTALYFGIAALVG